MENSLLVQAHTLQRRAEAHLKARRFQESIEAYKKAGDHVTEALGLTTNEKLLDALGQQREHFFKQTQIVAFKREQYENYRKALEGRRRESDFENCHDNESTTLQVAIYKIIDTADSILDTLRDNHSSSSDSEVDGVIGTKRPKNDTEIIEELRTLNEQLHTLVYKLVTQLDASKQEAMALKERIRQLENEKTKFSAQNNTPSSLKVATDSSGGTSPFVVSPCGELSPEAATIPTLAPLEMPSFDFRSVVAGAPQMAPN